MVAHPRCAASLAAGHYGIKAGLHRFDLITLDPAIEDEQVSSEGTRRRTGSTSEGREMLCCGRKERVRSVTSGEAASLKNAATAAVQQAVTRHPCSNKNTHNYLSMAGRGTHSCHTRRARAAFKQARPPSSFQRLLNESWDLHGF